MNHTAEGTIYAASWLFSPNAAPLSGGGILVRNGLIAAVGPLDELRRSHSAAVNDHPGCAILPGFVNAHTHLELTHFPSWRLRSQLEYHPRRFVDWIIQLIKVKRGLTIENYQASVREGIRMCLESGTTAVGEIVTNPALADIYCSEQLSGRLYFELLGHDQERFGAMLRKALEAALSVTDGKFGTGLSPHAPYTIGDNIYPLIVDSARTAGLPLAIHCSESASETDFIFGSGGPLAEEFYPFVGWERYLGAPRRCSSIELLDRAGLLLANALAIHCVQVTRADAEILRQRGVSVVLCPRSNERLDVGRAPVALLKKLGIPLALGTDSLASNDSLSLWDELRFALNAFPDSLTPADVFRMATSAGAEALGIAAAQGTLEIGKRANFQVVGGVEGLTEAKNPLERILFSGTVQDVYVAGQRYSLDK